MRHLLTIPGVGLATAASLVAVIGDVGRFPRPHKLVSYLPRINAVWPG
jgi:transposase